MALPIHATISERIWHYCFIAICVSVFFFLIFPILIILPLSFNQQPYFSFTAEMLRLQPDAYTTKWYQEFFTSLNWQGAVKNSFIIAFFSTIISTFLGTLAALGLSRPDFPFKTTIMGLLISPMVVPLIISAAGMFFFYSRIGLQGTHVGVILAHAALATPFVVIVVTATLSGFDHSLTRATDFTRGHLRGAVRVYHFIRRSRGCVIRRKLQSKNHPLANVFRNQGTDQSHHHGSCYHIDYPVGVIISIFGANAPA